MKHIYFEIQYKNKDKELVHSDSCSETPLTVSPKNREFFHALLDEFLDNIPNNELDLNPETEAHMVFKICGTHK